MNNDRLEIMQKTAERIRHFRAIKGFSQESLALSAGLNPAFLGLIERSVKCPSIDTLNKIASALGISLSELVNFDSGKESKGNYEAIGIITFAINGLPEDEACSIARIINEIVGLVKCRQSKAPN